MPLPEVLELDEAQIAQTVLAERVNVFTDRAIAAAITSPLGTILLAWFQAPVTGWPRAVAWLCLINPPLLLMIGIGYRVRLARSRGEDALPWVRWMIFAVSLAGFGWGSSVWFFWTEGQYLFYMLDLLVLVGVAGIDVIIMSPFRIATVLFTGGVVLPPMLHLALVQNPFGVQLAAGLTILFVLVLQHGRVAEKQLVEGLEYAVRNQVMARALGRRTVVLEATQAELNRAQMVGNVGSWVSDITADTLRLSAEACRILGLPEGSTETLQGYLARTQPEDRGAVNRAWQAALKGAAFDHEHRIVIGNEIRWVRQKAAFKYAADGSPLSAEGTVQDISDRKQADQALRQSEERYRALIEWSPEPLAVHRGGKLIYVNPAAIKMFGATSAQDLVGTPVLDRLHPDFRQMAMARMKSIASNGGATPPLEEKYLKLDGTVIDLAVQGTSIIYDGEPAIQASMRDITERKAAEARITHLNRVYAVLSSINTMIIRARDRDELFRQACRIAVDTGGFRMALIAIVDRSAMKIVPVASAGKDEALLTAIKGILSSTEDAPNTMVARALREKKAIVSNDSQSDPQVLFGKQYVESGVRAMAVLPLLVSDEAVGVLALYASEIEFFHEDELKLLTELTDDIAFAIDHIDKQARLDYLAYYDALTGLANRRLFLERVGQYLHSAASGGHKLAVLLIDLERFKSINDSLGRPAGDALLRQVADWLKRDSGDANLVARLDADHFATVLPIVKEEGDGAQLLETTMQAFMDHPFRLNDAVFRIAARVGVAVFPDDGADADTLFRNAEAALKKTKGRGERYLFYTQAMTETVAASLTLENQLRQALDNEEFVLHYQPKVNLASGKLTSAEALIRWNDPRTGLVPPGRFIPILEETGLIYDVGRWALKKAIEDYLRWRAAGLPAVRIAVNVSPLQLRNRGFVDEISQVIGIEEHAAAGLELEITESLIMENVKHNIASLQAIRQMGVRIAIDDFGTGFSSLSYLAKLPVDTLKIDRSFVTNMTAEPEGLALVSTIINLAHSLELKVVAEGVETEEQSRLLRLLKCDEMQGFVFSKPVPSDIFETKFLTPSPAG